MQTQRLLTWLYALLTALAACILVWLIWHVLRVIAPVATVAGVGALLAVLLSPLADRIQRAVRSRPLAALAVVLLVLTPFVIVVVWLVTTVAREAQALLTALPQQFKFANAVIANWQALLASRGLQVQGLHIDVASAASRAGDSLLRHAATVLTGVATVTTDSVLVLVVAFFLILDGERMTQTAYRLLPSRWQPAAHDASRILASTVADYVRGQFLVGAVFGVLVGVSMALLGLPYSALLGFLAGVFELVPAIGPILAAVGPVLLSLSQPFPHVVWVLLVFIAAQQVESNLLVPRISGGAVGLHPLTVILAVFTGWTVAGFVGALLAVPAVAVAREILRHWWQPALPAPARRWPAPGLAVRRVQSQAEGEQPVAEAGMAPVRAQPPAPPAPTPARTGRRARGRSRS